MDIKDTPAPQFKQTWGIDRTAQTAVYEAWRTGNPVRLVYRGAGIEVTTDTLVVQVVAKYRAKGVRYD